MLASEGGPQELTADLTQTLLYHLDSYFGRLEQCWSKRAKGHVFYPPHVRQAWAAKRKNRGKADTVELGGQTFKVKHVDDTELIKRKRDAKKRNRNLAKAPRGASVQKRPRSRG